MGLLPGKHIILKLELCRICHEDWCGALLLEIVEQKLERSREWEKRESVPKMSRYAIVTSGQHEIVIRMILLCTLNLLH